ncbi:MAG: PIG-L family deacetylase [Erythrobacter sp.]|nr:PIG-L family deacetylase [Erythrobacter sp.]
MSVPQQPDGTMVRWSARAPVVELETLAPADGVLIVCPHPDDETLGCGQALAAAAAAGRRIAIVLLTDGEGSHSGSKTFGRQRLVETRLAEFDRALNILAPGQSIPVLRLGLPDGASRFETVTPAQIDQIVSLAHELGRPAIWSTWREDPHCDHESASLLASHIAEQMELSLWSFAVWGRFGERELPGGLVRFERAALLSAKRRAMDAYATQLTGMIDDDPNAFLMPAALCRHFADHPELFIRER